jgi:hypothetical protein
LQMQEYLLRGVRGVKGQIDGVWRCDL